MKPERKDGLGDKCLNRQQHRLGDLDVVHLLLMKIVRDETQRNEKGSKLQLSPIAPNIHLDRAKEKLFCYIPELFFV
ncbi:hypothetical protein DAPPUDRAFT_235727 [Daphnia pulex]|uniref:Uncharacterized protein n=1 Tax=Daphnia pulex TaxID=6669 RepID=E9G0N7_DAPPU|nr:hypothetical protein DAPPUDRAFT_235727 [Daphnia pulex]|eukprot:EFX87370.1 hypothetical protein DAPPUDRAFT_235727 [Daphnia pulex]